MTDLPRHVVATAGHVDHGKSALIRALTGIEPDRLEEERRRGLTIDLGYAWTSLPSGREVGFVDVPGHERFVKNMLAGVGPVRLVLFVVAADEGWKPQSEEHLQIVDVLGADRAVVALTKADAVDEDTLALRRREIGERLAGTALDGAPVVAVSSLTGEGVPEVAEALDAMLAAAAPPETTGRPRLFVDRVFSMRGSGTVVTGTLTGGPLQLDDPVVLLPSGTRARIRGLQTHGRTIERAVPVSRVAVNLSALATEDAHRGDALVRLDEWRTTRVFEGTLRAAGGLERPLSARGAFKVHAGAAERDARIRLLGRDRLEPGEEGFVRVTLSAPLVLDPGEPYVLREVGMRATLGGGRVLDPHPPARPGPDPAARLEARRVPRPGLPAAVVAERGAVSADELAAVTGVRSKEVANGRRLSQWWVAEWLLDAQRDAVRARLESHHRANPLSPGLSVEELRRTAGTNGALTDILLQTFVREGLIERAGTLVRLAGHRIELGDREQDAQRVEAALEDGWPAPPTAAELTADRDLLHAMVETGRAVEVSRELYLLPGQIVAAEAVVRELAAGPEGMTASAFRKRLGTSRKYAIPLLELFDTRGLTRRSGDLRRLREPSGDDGRERA